MRVPSIIITRMEGEGGTKTKDREYKDIWCEAPESRTYSEYDILEELWGNWPTEEASIACAYKKRNFWNCSVKVLWLMIEPDEANVAVFVVWWFINLRWFMNIRLWSSTRFPNLILLSQLGTLSWTVKINTTKDTTTKKMRDRQREWLLTS